MLLIIRGSPLLRKKNSTQEKKEVELGEEEGDDGVENEVVIGIG